MTEALMVLLGLLALAVLLGFALGLYSLAERRRQLDERQQLLDIEWRQLDTTRRLRDIFRQARRQMADEALRNMPGAAPFHRREDDR